MRRYPKVEIYADHIVAVVTKKKAPEVVREEEFCEDINELVDQFKNWRWRIARNENLLALAKLANKARAIMGEDDIASLFAEHPQIDVSLAELKRICERANTGGDSRVIGSSFLEWIIGTQIARVFEKHFGRAAPRSREGPFVRFVNMVEQLAGERQSAGDTIVTALKLAAAIYGPSAKPGDKKVALARWKGDRSLRGEAPIHEKEAEDRQNAGPFVISAVISKPSNCSPKAARVTKGSQTSD